MEVVDSANIAESKAQNLAQIFFNGICDFFRANA